MTEQDAQARIAALEAENAELKRTLVKAAIPLEALYMGFGHARGLSAVAQNEIRNAVQATRRVLLAAPRQDGTDGAS